MRGFVLSVGRHREEGDLGALRLLSLNLRVGVSSLTTKNHPKKRRLNVPTVLGAVHALQLTHRLGER